MAAAPNMELWALGPSLSDGSKPSLHGSCGQLIAEILEASEDSPTIEVIQKLILLHEGTTPIVKLRDSDAVLLVVVFSGGLGIDELVRTPVTDMDVAIQIQRH